MLANEAAPDPYREEAFRVWESGILDGPPMNGQGKLFAVLLLLLLLCFLWKLGEGKQKDLFSYGGIAAAACIFPLTAVLLMLWQTKFYDYEFVWTIVPLTALIACAGVLACNSSTRNTAESVSCASKL